MPETEIAIALACKAWRKIFPVHPACEIIPPYTDSKLLELGRDIKASGGMKIPIIVLVHPDGRLALLDGRSRVDALCHVGIKFEIKVIDGHVVIDAPGYEIPAPTEIVPDGTFNPVAFVLSVNRHRRHLTSEDKRNIAKKVICAQPALSDRAIAQMVGFDHKTIKRLRLEIEANGENPHKADRVETTGRKARGRKPTKVSIAKPVDVTPTTPTADQPPVTPIAAVAKAKPAATPNAFAEILAAAHRVLEVLRRPVSAPNNESAQNEIRRLIKLVLAHKSLKPPAKAA
jgi:hypothetical protein